MPATIAVIDIGKTNAKVVLHRPGEAGDARHAHAANPVATGGPYPHYDIERLWRFILDALAALDRERRVDGISITTHGATAALVTGDGLALPVLDYEHDGPEETARGLRCAAPALRRDSVAAPADRAQSRRTALLAGAARFRENSPKRGTSSCIRNTGRGG